MKNITHPITFFGAFGIIKAIQIDYDIRSRIAAQLFLYMHGSVLD